MLRERAPSGRMLVAAALVAGIGAVSLGQQCPSGKHICRMPIITESGSHQWPVGFDLTPAMQARQKTIIAQAQRAANVAKQKIGGDRPAPQPSGQPEAVSVLPAASLETVKKAASLIVNGPALLCPQSPNPDKPQYQFSVEAGKPESTLCIDAKHLKLVSDGSVVVAARLNPKTGKVINLAASLNKPENKDRCPQITNALSQFTDALFHEQGHVASSESVSVLVVGDITAPGKGQCDTFVKPSAAVHDDQVQFVPIS